MFSSGCSVAFEALMQETPYDHFDSGCDGICPECRSCLWLLLQCYGADHLFRFGVRLCGRYGTDALWAYSIWNNPEMGQYLPDEAKEEIDDEYLKMLEGLGEDKECCYLTPVFKNSLERVGTCSFMISDDKKVYDIAYCVHKNFWCQGYATEIAQGMIDYARSQGAEKVTIYVGQENAASNRVAQKCGGKIVSESTYKKKGTDIIMKDYKYEIVL